MDRLLRLRAFLEHDPDDLFTRFAIALELVNANDDELACAAFQEILLRDPSYIGAYLHFGKCLERLGRADEARDTYIRGIDSARLTKDTHAASELTVALEELD
jgi:Tfp pilus assembly protein PilF